MPTNKHRFSLEELLAALSQAPGIHGRRRLLNVEFAATGTSVMAQTGSTKSVSGPLISVTGATLVTADCAAEGAVDAAVLNPLPCASPAKSTRAKKMPAIAIH